VQLEQLGTFAREAVRSWAAKGAPVCPDVSVSSLGSGEREAKDGEQ